MSHDGQAIRGWEPETKKSRHYTWMEGHKHLTFTKGQLVTEEQFQARERQKAPGPSSRRDIVKTSSKGKEEKEEEEEEEDVVLVLLVVEEEPEGTHGFLDHVRSVHGQSCRREGSQREAKTSPMEPG